MAKPEYAPRSRVRATPDGAFYVYTHARPCGAVFYVGKGRERRAWDFSPSRRTLHHRNIVEKHGLHAIKVVVHPCASEADAFDAEKRLIAEFRAAGVVLINRTNGGEGASRPSTPSQLEALARGRAKRVYAGPGFDRFLAAGAVAQLSRVQSPEHRAFTAKLGRLMAERRKAEPPRQVSCRQCGASFESKAARVWTCSKLCQQRLRRAKEKEARPPKRPSLRPDNTSGVTGVYWNKKSQVWTASVCLRGKLSHLGRFATKDDAVAARRLADAQKVLNDTSQHRHSTGVPAAS